MSSKKTTLRLDELLVSKGFAETRNKAQRLILAGKVRTASATLTKPGARLPEETELAIETPEQFVSRGGEKLAFALEHFKIKVAGLICLDIGASTGGFTDCLLQYGAKLVYAIDAGTAQLHWKLRQDNRVISMEKTNARYLTPEMFKEHPAFATIDVSFISLTKIMPAITNILHQAADMVTLIKPQFEAERHEISKGGVVRSDETRMKIIEKIKTFGEQELALQWQGVCKSPLLGPKGNVEFLAHWKTKL
jgi:23S rRNA (cytidine1920-2'-O)/16S rRNA (cytidine1409-2'-O)-methyltransferase